MEDDSVMGEIKDKLQAGALLQGNYSYRVLSALGQGSFGITYKAEIRVVGPLGELPGEKTKVAIKEYFLRECSSREQSGFIQESSDNSLVKRYREKFVAEARNLSKMKGSPDIVSVVEDFSANNTHYYVMEYIEGCNLDEYICKKGGLSEDEALNYIRQIGKALIYMHTHGMLHLDLKPKNVMRRPDGSLVLIDFGLSKQYDTNGEPESSTTVGLGTPGYAPVEQATGALVGKDDKIPYTLDVYALGATLYKLLVAKTPPHASELINVDFPEAKLEERGVSQRTISAIRKAMSPRVSDRPQDVQDFLRLLEIGEEKERISREGLRRFSTENDDIGIGRGEETEPSNPKGVEGEKKKKALEKREDKEEINSNRKSYRSVFVAVIFCLVVGAIWQNWSGKNMNRKRELEISSETVDTTREREWEMAFALQLRDRYWENAWKDLDTVLSLGSKLRRGEIDDATADKCFNVLLNYHSMDSLDLIYRQNSGWEVKILPLTRMEIVEIKQSLKEYYEKKIRKMKVDKKDSIDKKYKDLLESNVRSYQKRIDYLENILK